MGYIACQIPLSMGFSRQEYWSGLSFLLQGIFLIQGLNLNLLHWQTDSLRLSHHGVQGLLSNAPVTKGCLAGASYQWRLHFSMKRHKLRGNHSPTPPWMPWKPTPKWHLSFISHALTALPPAPPAITQKHISCHSRCQQGRCICLRQKGVRKQILCRANVENAYLVVRHFKSCFR